MWELLRKLCCIVCQSQTVEEIVAENSINMTPQEKSAYWYELNQSTFALLGKIDIDIFKIPVSEWVSVARNQYPTLTNIKIADSTYYTTDLEGIASILKRDWTNLVPYVADTSDCDKFATRLYNHLVDYYKITGIVPVWGDTDRGYHGFNLAVLKKTNGWVARLIEPQSDEIFIDSGPLGDYKPRETSSELGVKKIRS